MFHNLHRHYYLEFKTAGTHWICFMEKWMRYIIYKNMKTIFTLLSNCHSIVVFIFLMRRVKPWIKLFKQIFFSLTWCFNKLTETETKGIKYLWDNYSRFYQITKIEATVLMEVRQKRLSIQISPETTHTNVHVHNIQQSNF